MHAGTGPTSSPATPQRERKDSRRSTLCTHIVWGSGDCQEAGSGQQNGGPRPARRRGLLRWRFGLPWSVLAAIARVATNHRGLEPGGSPFLCRIGGLPEHRLESANGQAVRPNPIGRTRRTSLFPSRLCPSDAKHANVGSHAGSVRWRWKSRWSTPRIRPRSLISNRPPCAGWTKGQELRSAAGRWRRDSAPGRRRPCSARGLPH
jgi:hypothetical protein